MALSVSISAKISPSLTVSPTFIFHFATVPSSIVSLSLGIVMTSAPSGIATVSEDAPVSAEGATTFFSSGSDVVTSPPESSAEMSSPLSPIIAKSVSTGAVPPS